ncbi:chemotaxis signal transduction protein [Xenococcus sp. PCC 7305]|uniref:chemotaxis protein CheW n=1 Tax=Xenococcus sp. PCC 7305 TaxID=102125 RepID=UPI0002ABD8DD|nr:chemotaxis protein CheW [Xenococcus sp. PCC 7305]ELS05166.1 chemotaxis signal transduction protein [Xenococcus sp. PCC 7305]
MAISTTKDRLKELLPELFSEQEIEGDSYLRLQLNSQVFAVIDLNQVQESLVISSREITTIPNVPEYVLGLMTSRNEVFLAVDLAHLIGLSPEIVNCRQYQVIVVKPSFDNKQIKETYEQSDNPSFLGLVVDRILGVSRFVYDDFDSSNRDIPTTLEPFVYGSIQHQENQYLVLDIKSLIANRISKNN